MCKFLRFTAVSIHRAPLRSGMQSSGPVLLHDTRRVAFDAHLCTEDAQKLQTNLALQVFIQGYLPQRSQLTRTRELPDEPADLLATLARITLVSARQLWQERRFVATLSALDDTAFAGGLPCGMLTELAGSDRAGRTTLALQWAAVCAAVHGRHVMILRATPAEFPARQLEGLVNAVLAHTARYTPTASRSALQRITVVQHLHTVDDLLRAMTALRRTLRGADYSLVIVDSVAAFAANSPAQGASGRSSSLLSLAGELKHLATDCEVAVVLLNLARSANADSAPVRQAAEFATRIDDRAQLGVAFYHAVNVRLFLQQQPLPYTPVLHVLKSSTAKATSYSVVETMAQHDTTVPPKLPITLTLLDETERWLCVGREAVGDVEGIAGYGDHTPTAAACFVPQT
jgi:archaellum biogenesis ATPase FlaH